MPASPELRREIENLAFSVVMANPETAGIHADWIPSIRKIRERAVAEQAVAIADAAESAQQGAVEPQEAVARLQHAMEVDLEANAGPLPLAQDPELLRDFVFESRENLLAIETQTLKLERE